MSSQDLQGHRNWMVTCVWIELIQGMQMVGFNIFSLHFYTTQSYKENALAD